MTMNFIQDRGPASSASKTESKPQRFLYEVVPPTPLSYHVLLVITHPDVAPDVISKRLRREPRHSWKAGDPSTTPDGAAIGGVRKRSAWSSSKQKRGHRAFFDGVKDTLDLLERHAGFLRELTDGGGEVSITVQLSGRNNIGDLFEAADMRRMAALGVSLGVEVFPDMLR